MSEHASPAIEQLQQVMDRLLSKGRPLRVLEAGCGSSTHLRLPEDRWLVGIDISQRQLERHAGLNERILGDLQEYEWPNNSFDLIVCWDVLEHLFDPGRAMMRMFGALREGGVVVLALPNRSSLKGWITRLTPFAVHSWFYRYIIGDTRPRDQIDQFPTFFRADVAPARIRTYATVAGLATEHYQLYEGPVQIYLRKRNRLANVAFGVLGGVSRLLTLGRYDPNYSDCMIVLRKLAILNPHRLTEPHA